MYAGRWHGCNNPKCVWALVSLIKPHSTCIAAHRMHACTVSLFVHSFCTSCMHVKRLPAECVTSLHVSRMQYTGWLCKKYEQLRRYMVCEATTGLSSTARYGKRAFLPSGKQSGKQRALGVPSGKITACQAGQAGKIPSGSRKTTARRPKPTHGSIAYKFMEVLHSL